MLASSCVYIPSDGLHSKTSSVEGTKVVAVSHKSNSSFYKSTRRANRSVQQVWTSFVAGNEEDDCCVSEVYLLYETGNKNAAAMQTRLAKEFGPSEEHLHVKHPNKVIEAVKFTLNRKANGLNVIFVDLDSLASTENDSSLLEMQSLLDCISDNMLVRDKHTLMHIKSAVICKAFHKDTSKCMTGEELKTFLSTEHAIIKSHITGDLIRRLNKKNVAAKCPLTNYPIRYVCSSNAEERKEICRFYNYDERGCLRSTKAERNPNLKGCDMDHTHCHRCGCEGHKAYECRDVTTEVGKSVLFKITEEGDVVSVPLDGDSVMHNNPRDVLSPSLLVLGGRCRGRTLNSCEFLPLLPTTGKWTALPNLQEHRGSHAACSPKGTRLAFVLGGGGIDGNSDSVELLDLRTPQTQLSIDDSKDLKWNSMAEKLSSARHAFEAVCVTTSNTNDVAVNIFAVGGWMYGSKSCESIEKLCFKVSHDRSNEISWQNEGRWVKCSPLLTPRRLHSVAASTDGSSIYVFGGYIGERNVTTSIESYDIEANCWNVVDQLPNPVLVQAVPDWSLDANNSFIIFPFSDNNASGNWVLRYTTNDSTFEPVVEMPIKNYHSFSATVSQSLRKAYLVGGLIDSKWTGRAFALDLDTMTWQELPEMSLPRRRLAALVME
ncbi:hypothetical protein ACHAWC_011014 [Mediolabrus comicus]